MRQHPIYNRVHGLNRQSSADFGSRDGFTQTVLVGSGSQNSHELGVIQVTTDTDEQGRTHFRLWLDGIPVKHGVWEHSTKEFNLQA